MADQDLTLSGHPDQQDEAASPLFASPPDAATAAEGSVADGGAYTVLARKYRPQTFEDLIGQETMVRTLSNAFASGRVAHAFMLTGVRGVGKTTTARLLARALNYETDEVRSPSLAHLAIEGRHCRAIVEGRHLDVLEVDAASRTKIDDMRELLDGVRYAPAEARYKVYIIDEVHMLSTYSFNALLKTLEEPPPHAKFIFATTEIRKVPVTILSRCQRFDLRRVEPEVISASLAAIASAEGARIETEALALIARAAEGSVRDAQSLLDQAIVQSRAGQSVTGEEVRDMLGLADRAQTIELFEMVVRGEAGGAIEAFRTLHGFGAEPGSVILDLLQHCHGASVAKAIGPKSLRLPQDQAARLAAIGDAVSAGSLARLWQMLLKAHAEVAEAPDPAAAVEMALIRLGYAADLPGPEEALKALQVGDDAGVSSPRPIRGGGPSAALSRMAPEPARSAPTLASPQSFEDVVRLIDERRDIALRLDVEKYVRPISFRPGAIGFEPAVGAPSNLAHRLASQLKAWTGQAWLVAAEGGGGAETLLERQRRAGVEARSEALAEPFVQAVMEAFPGVEIVDVRQIEVPAPAPSDDGAEMED